MTRTFTLHQLVSQNDHCFNQVIRHMYQNYKDVFLNIQLEVSLTQLVGVRGVIVHPKG
jgi:hypothetical protein